MMQIVSTISRMGIALAEITGNKIVYTLLIALSDLLVCHGNFVK